MRIGIDIDDTITDSYALMTKYAEKHFQRNDKHFINEIFHAPKITGEGLDFYNLYLKEVISKCPLKENAKEVIQRLQENGHTIIVITARGYTDISGVTEETEKYFQKHNLKVDKIIFKAYHKLKVCQDNQIDIMVDDTIRVLDEINKGGIKTVLFTTYANKDIKTNLNRVNDWLELEEYINNI